VPWPPADEKAAKAEGVLSFTADALSVSRTRAQASVERVWVASDGRGCTDLRPSVKISKWGQRIIAAGGMAGELAIGGGTNPGSLSGDMRRFESVDQWREALKRAEILLAGHMQVFHRLVEDLEAHGELPGSYIDTMFAVEAAETSNRMRRVERRPAEPPMRRRTTPWQIPVLAR
jgi:hypothetical protein